MLKILKVVFTIKYLIDQIQELVYGWLILYYVPCNIPDLIFCIYIVEFVR